MNEVSINRSDPTINHNDPLFLQPTDTPGITLIAIQLTETENYALWSRYMKIALLGKNKLGFVDGSCARSSYTGVLLKRWERCNAIVLSWIMNVVSKELMIGIAYASDSRRVWENLKEKFDKENSVRTFHLHKEIAFLTQGSSTVSTYFSKLSDLWDEFDTLIPPLTCNCETSKIYTEHIKKHRIFQFLTGLNDSYSRAKNLEISESTALMTNKPTQNYRSKRSDLYCEYCRRSGHIKTVCRKLLGQTNDRNFQNNRGYQHERRDYHQDKVPQDNRPKMKQQYYSKPAVNYTVEEPPKQISNEQIALIFSLEQYYQIQQMIRRGQEPEVQLIQSQLTLLVLLVPLTQIQDLCSGKVLGIGRESGGLYLFGDISQSIISSPTASTVVNNIVPLSTWHRRLGHMPIAAIQKMDKFLLHKVDKSSGLCPVCPLARQTKLPFPIRTTHSNVIFDLLHADVWGTYRVPTVDGKRFFLTIVDDFSRLTWLFLMNSKDETYWILKNLFSMIQTQYNSAVKILRTDNGSEFINLDVHKFLLTQGTIHQTTCAYTPQQNGVVKKRHKYILEIARALRFEVVVPISFWSDCVLTVVHIINRIPSSVLQNKSPFEMFFLSPPSLDHLKFFGCLAYAFNVQRRDKFAARALPTVFMGYSATKKGYKLYDIHSKRFFFSRDVVFHESVFLFKQMTASNDPAFPVLNLTDVLPVDNMTNLVIVRYTCHLLAKLGMKNVFLPSSLRGSIEPSDVAVS